MNPELLKEEPRIVDEGRLRTNMLTMQEARQKAGLLVSRWGYPLTIISHEADPDIGNSPYCMSVELQSGINLMGLPPHARIVAKVSINPADGSVILDDGINPPQEAMAAWIKTPAVKVFTPIRVADLPAPVERLYNLMNHTVSLQQRFGNGLAVRASDCTSEAIPSAPAGEIIKNRRYYERVQSEGRVNSEIMRLSRTLEFVGNMLSTPTENFQIALRYQREAFCYLAGQKQIPDPEPETPQAKEDDERAMSQRPRP